MLSKKLIGILDKVTKEVGIMVPSFVDKKDLTGKVDFASIYSHSEKDFDKLTKELQSNGSVYDNQPTGNYYWLNKPLPTKVGLIRRCRVRVFDNEHPERGYCDFEVVNYKKFKNKYLGRPNFKLLDNREIEMIELRVPGYNVRAYFPDINFEK